MEADADARDAHEDAAAYGDTIADIYDERAPAATAAEIEFLAALADGLDLMAGTTGLRLRERYGDWERQAFAASSQRFVSVYGAS